MNGALLHTQVLGAMITPAVLISAAGTLVLSTSNRLGRVVDRVRGMSAEAERSLYAPATGAAKRRFIADQLAALTRRMLLLRSTITVLYLAIGLFVATSILVGVDVILAWHWGWPPVVTGLAGAIALLAASVMLVREARMAVRATLLEVAFVRDEILLRPAPSAAPPAG